MNAGTFGTPLVVHRTSVREAEDARVPQHTVSFYWNEIAQTVVIDQRFDDSTGMTMVLTEDFYRATMREMNDSDPPPRRG